MKLLIVISCLLVYAHAAVNRDESFQSMCKFYSGSYKERSDYNAMTGDTCTLVFDQATENNETAKMYCEEQVPFHINAATPLPLEYSTQCTAEATLICESNWIQMFGRCYKMEKALMTRDEAGDFCKKIRPGGATIAFMHREALPFRIRDYFSHVSRLWLDASEAITNNLIYNVLGGHLILAIDGYNYNLPNLALARVAPTEKAMVLCEYTPKMTRAESNYLLKRFGEIYYPTVQTSEGSFVRTASSLNRNENDNLADTKYCTKVMKPFIPGGQAQSAVPTKEFMEKVKETNSRDRGLIIRTSAISSIASKDVRQKKTCAARNVPDFRIYFPTKDGKEAPKKIDQSNWKSGEPKEQCDAASWSSAIVLSRDGPARLETMSDARYAPIYCQTVTEKLAYDACPNGFKEYKRESTGQIWCHQYIFTKYSFDDAEKNCQSLDKRAHVSGYVDNKEWDFMFNMQLNHQDVWLGARRRETCNRPEHLIDGWTKKENHECSRVNVFQWANGVAPNPPCFEDKDWATPTEPNFSGAKEFCLMRWSWNKLNDDVCSKPHASYCGMEAPIITVS